MWEHVGVVQHVGDCATETRVERKRNAQCIESKVEQLAWCELDFDRVIGLDEQQRAIGAQVQGDGVWRVHGGSVGGCRAGSKNRDLMSRTDGDSPTGEPMGHCVYWQHVVVRVLIPPRNGYARSLGCEKNRGHAGEEQYHVCCDFSREPGSDDEPATALAAATQRIGHIRVTRDFDLTIGE